MSLLQFSKVEALTAWEMCEEYAKFALEMMHESMRIRNAAKESGNEIQAKQCEKAIGEWNREAQFQFENCRVYRLAYRRWVE